ncbi:MAG: hypothetical protein KIT62_17310 [Cyclobacteriaceae bacterium]|nr:hypothetical protein [Cyclobacteriaceae bacterium]
MTELDERFIAWWEEKRKAGKWKYAFKHGVLLFALPVYTAVELFRYFSRTDYELSVTRIVIGALIWSILGLLSFGLIQWQTQERRYQKIKSQNS